jgi:UDP-glucose 4-epimerase
MNSKSDNYILVTGGAGFIGAHLVNYLVKHGEKVIVLDDLSGGFIENVNTNASFIKGSITDKELVNSIFEENNIQYVFHLAAYAAEGLSHFIRRFNYTNNVLGSINLINAAIKNEVKCFVFTSSIAVYGENQLPMSEEMDPLPEDPYGIAKYAVELDLKAANKQFGLNYIIFRPHNVYGEFQNIGDRYRNVIGIFMNQILQNKPLTIFGDGKQIRAFTYINDIIPAISNSIHLKQYYNEIYNIGSDKTYTVNQVAKEVMHAMKKDVPINYLAARNEVKYAYSSHDKLRNTYRKYLSNDTPLSIGIQSMADWVEKIGSRTSSEFRDIELRKNLPESWRH